MGDSLVARAEQYAVKHDQQNLRMDSKIRVHWMGKGGMVWAGLLQKIQYEMLHKANPAMIIIHVGGNDIVRINGVQFAMKQKEDIEYLQSVFPKTIIVWSDILPRLVWKFATSDADGPTLDLKRKRVNRRARQAITRIPCGRVMTHKITRNAPNNFLPDGTHLAEEGNNIFIDSIKKAIEQFLFTEGNTNKYVNYDE